MEKQNGDTPTARGTRICPKGSNAQMLHDKKKNMKRGSQRGLSNKAKEPTCESTSSRYAKLFSRKQKRKFYNRRRKEGERERAEQKVGIQLPTKSRKYYVREL